MDERIHRYELDLKGMVSELAELLADRGYCTVGEGPGDTWVFESRWGRGAAYGEIGSTLYGLIATRLRELE